MDVRVLRPAASSARDHSTTAPRNPSPYRSVGPAPLRCALRIAPQPIDRCHASVSSTNVSVTSRCRRAEDGARSYEAPGTPDEALPPTSDPQHDPPAHLSGRWTTRLDRTSAGSDALSAPLRETALSISRCTASSLQSTVPQIGQTSQSASLEGQDSQEYSRKKHDADRALPDHE